MNAGPVRGTAKPDPPVLPADQDPCAQEAIHTPGSIQPHGYLFILNEADLTVVAASTNAADALDLAPTALIGRPIAALLASTTNMDLESALRSPHAETAIRVRFSTPTRSAELDGLVHYDEIYMLLELTPRMPADRVETLFRQVRFGVARIRESKTEESACQALATGIRRLTGFDRVLVYRFDSDWNGQVVAEDKAENACSYYGQTFPASDVPPQVRALYTNNTVRLIPNITYVPSCIYPATLPPSGLSIDLSKVILRSISPIHLEYLANMGVAASMSVSVVRDGLLWGLVACHHFSPRSLSYDELRACEPLAREMAWYLHTKDRWANAECLVTMRYLEGEFLAPSGDVKDYREWLAPLAPSLFHITRSQGLVICDDKAVWTAGEVPTEQQIAALIDWLRSSNEDRIVTDRLSARFPAANAYCAVASGMTANKIANGWLIWFRAEWEHEVIWAGDPGKPIMSAGSGGQTGPRKSFAPWCEQVRGHSQPWTAADVFAVGQVHTLVLGAMMDDRVRQDFRRRKFETVGGLAHELNSLLQPIISTAQIVLEDHQADTQLAEEMTLILDSANRAAEIVRGMLLYVRIPRKERRHVSLADVLAGELDLLRCTLPPGIRLHFRAGPTARQSRIPSSELGQIVRNLVDNAVHALEGRGEVTVNVDEVQVTDAHADLMPVPPGNYGRISVADNGPGIAPALLTQIFEPFFTTKDIGQGTGLGLSIVEGLVRSRGGTITVHNVPERGAVFEIMLPSFDVPADTGNGLRSGMPERRRRRSDA